MRISKQNSEIIAKQLMQKKKEKVNALLLEYQQGATDEYIKQTPKEVLEMSVKHPEYFALTNYVAVSGHGFRWEQIKTVKPVIKKGFNEPTLILNDKISDKLTKLKRKHQSAKDQYDQLLSEIETALLNLRTYANIEKNIPEAAPFLPKGETMALAINFDDIRSKIKAA